MKIAKIYRAAVVAKKHLLYLPLMVLIFCVASCSDENSPQKDTSTRTKLHELSSSPICHIDVVVDEDLDEYILSENEVQAQLNSELQAYGIERPDMDYITIQPVYSEDYAPYLTTLVCHVDWTGSVYEDIITSLTGQGSIYIPSTLYYVVNFPNDSGCAILSADSRKDELLLLYNEVGSIPSTDLDPGTYMANWDYFDGRMHGIDSLTLAHLHTLCGLSTNFPADLQTLMFVTEMAHYGGSLGGSCQKYQTDPINVLTDSISNANQWNNTTPYVDANQATTTNIPLIIVKLLTYEGYVGSLCNEPFDGTLYRTGNLVDEIADWTNLLYAYLSSNPTMTMSEMGQQLLESCGFNFTTPSIIPPATPFIDLWLPSMYLIDIFASHFHPGIVFVDDNHWELIVGIQYIRCATIGYSNGEMNVEYYDTTWKKCRSYKTSNLVYPAAFYVLDTD